MQVIFQNVRKVVLFQYFMAMTGVRFNYSKTKKK